MRPSYCCILALLLAAPAVGQLPPAPDRPPEATAGVLLLDSLELVEGSHELFGSLYRVRQPGGGMRFVPAGNVLFAGATKEDAYKFVQGKVGGDSVEGRLQLAEWCLKAGLFSPGLLEVKGALDQDPGNKAALALAKKLEDGLAKKWAKPAAPAAKPAAPPPQLAKQPEPPREVVRVPPPIDPPVPAKPKPVPARAAEESTPAVPAEVQPPAAGEYHPDTFPFFTAKVQPVLQNLCVSCHARPETAGAFRLTRMLGEYATPLVTKENAAAAAAFLNRDAPAASPLLVKAVTAHGGAKTPSLPTRDHPAYRNLEAWAREAVKPAGK